MILGIKNKKPTLTFGLGIFEKTIELGESVTIWQRTIYAEGEFTVTHKSTIPKVIISKNQAIYTPTAVGVYYIQVQAEDRQKTKRINSNKIKLTVV